MPDSIPSNGQNDSCGVIYLSFGYDYLLMAINSAISVKQFHPDLKISIVTNISLDTNNLNGEEIQGFTITDGLFDEVIYINDDNESNRNYKTSINDFSPYDRTLYLDSDTVVWKPIETGFNFLDYADIAFVSRPISSRAMQNWEGQIHIENINLNDMSNFHGGVFFFHRDRAINFFDQWTSKFEEFGYEYDQFSLVNAVYNTDVRLLPLPVIWDANDNDINRFTGFYNNYDFQSHVKIRHQNYHNRKRTKRLRKLDSLLGNRILDTDDEDPQKIRKKFQKKYNLKQDIKRRAARNPIIKSIYANTIKRL